MTSTDEKALNFLNNYLRTKKDTENILKKPDFLRQLVIDYNDIYSGLSVKERSKPFIKLLNLSDNQKNRVEMLEGLLRGSMSLEEFVESGVLAENGMGNVETAISKRGFDSYKLPLNSMAYFSESPEAFMESMPPMLREKTVDNPEGEKPTTPKVTAVSVTPRGGEKKILTPRRGGLRGGRKLTKEQIAQQEASARTKAQQEATARGEGAGMEDPAPVARPPEPLAMTEPDPTPVEVATGKVESGENNDPIADLEPPTFSPDQMNPPSIDMEIERQAQLAASSMRQGERPPAPAPAPAPENQGDLQGTREGQPITETKVKTGLEDIPNKTDLIPKERLSADFKNEAELISDINYFFKRFPNELKDIKKSYDSFPNKTLPYYKRTHRQIVARLQAGKGEKKKLGVIIEGEEFIKQKLKEVILEMRAEGLTNEDLLVDVEGDEETLRNDFGNYEVVVGESGLLHSQREPVYRYIPQTKKTIVPAEKVLEDKSKRARTQNLPTRFRSVYTHNAIRNQNNPFTKPTSQIKLKYLY